MTAEAGTTAERRRRLQLADHLGGKFSGTDALPARLATGMAHGEVALPRLAADAVAQHARPFQAVAAALGAVQRDLVVGPGDATREARTQLSAQIFDGQNGLGADLQGGGRSHGRTRERGTSDEVRQGRRQTQAGAA